MKRVKITNTIKSMGDNNLIALLMVGATLAVSVGVILGRLWIADIRFNNKVISHKNAVNATLEQNVAALPQLQENFRFLEVDGPKPEVVLRALPTTDEFPAFGRELEAIGASSGGRLTSVTKVTEVDSLDSIMAAPAPVPVKFQVAVVGSYQSLLSFMARLEEEIRPVQVNRLTFNGNNPSVNLSVELTTWWQPPTLVGNQSEEVHE